MCVPATRNLSVPHLLNVSWGSIFLALSYWQWVPCQRTEHIQLLVVALTYYLTVPRSAVRLNKEKQERKDSPIGEG
jgi:hypothetical protein